MARLYRTDPDVIVVEERSSTQTEQRQMTDEMLQKYVQSLLEEIGLNLERILNDAITLGERGTAMGVFMLRQSYLSNIEEMKKLETHPFEGNGQSKIYNARCLAEDLIKMKRNMTDTARALEAMLANREGVVLEMSRKFAAYQKQWQALFKKYNMPDLCAKSMLINGLKEQIEHRIQNMSSWLLFLVREYDHQLSMLETFTSMSTTLKSEIKGHEEFLKQFQPASASSP